MHDLNGILINPSTPILRAVQIIDASPVKIALAVDAKQQLRGTITDGDVRRGLLRGISLKEPVSRIMNRKPRFATFGEDSVALARKMQKELISQMPIFDARGRLVGIEILEDFLKPKILAPASTGSPTGSVAPVAVPALDVNITAGSTFTGRR